jgi:hypothetical protein
MSKPYSIKIFLPGGDPDGVRLIEKSTWSGAGLMIPRALFAEGRQRKELATVAGRSSGIDWVFEAAG